MRLSAFSALLVLGLAGPALASDKPKPLWDYMGGANDDEYWEKLSPDYAACHDGQEQSPITIEGADSVSLTPLGFHYQPDEVIVQRRELMLILQFSSKANYLTSEGEDYYLKQIRFHTPAEHDILGTTMPLEMQLIHQTAKGKVIMVAVQADVGLGNETLQAVVEHLPRRGHPEQKVLLNVSGLLPKVREYYAYDGSLTWPPCTEGVQWRVMKAPISISKEQLKAIEKLLGRNARLPKPVNGRRILQSKD